MNYPQSLIILEEIKKAKKILLNCHRGPDPDSIGGALAMHHVLQTLDKQTTIFCPDEMRYDLSFLPDFNKIQTVDYARTDFLEFDLFIIMDSSSYDVVTGTKDIQLPKIKTIVLDHHRSNTNYGDINLVDATKLSMGEMLLKVFEDWKINISPTIASCLLTGVIGDTGNFSFAGVGADTFEIGAKLMKLGADKESIVFDLFYQIPIERVRIVGELLKTAQIDKEHKFVWSQMNYKTFKDLGADKEAKNLAHALVFQKIKDTDFEFIIVEQEPNTLSVSFRARKIGYDISPMAVELGGGGHAVAGGAKIENISYEEGVEKILQLARNYATQA